MQFTHTPASYLVSIVVAGLQQIVAHAATFRGALDMIEVDANHRFGPGAIECTLTTGDYVRMTTFVGLEVENRIIPHDRPVPEDEPSAEEVDTTDNGGVHSLCTICLARIDVEQIPTLIDALTELHRAWLHAGGAA